MSLSLLTSLFVTVLGLVYAFAAFTLPQAAFGRPHEPKIFPAILACFLIAFGAAQLFQEIKARRAAGVGGKTFSGKAAAQIVATIANCLLYALIFERIGFVFSTILFLMIEFVIFDSWRVWKRGIIISVAFAMIMYLVFGLLLGIVLPRSPLGFV